MPRGTTLDVRLQRGTVRLSGTAGDVTVETELGNVEAAGLAGRRVTLRTQLGNIAAGFGALPTGAEVRIETENGNIALTLPDGTSADVEAETQTGSISVDGLAFTNRDFDQNGVRQHFRGRLGSGRADVRATTEVGSIRLTEGQRLELDGVELFRPEDDSTVVPPGAPVAPNPPVR